MLMLLVGVLTAVAAPSAGASRAAPAPLVVQSSTLVQSGQQVVWSVELGTPFSPGALAPAGARCACSSKTCATRTRPDSCA